MALWSVTWESQVLGERKKLRMASGGLVCIIRFEGLDKYLFNPLHKLLRIITDDRNRSFEKISNLPKLSFG